MDTEKQPPQGQAKNSSEQKPIIDQMIDLAANAAGVLADRRENGGGQSKKGGG
ncbi:hypothetical protein AB4Z51_43385 [Bradyrhizobium sp. 2TAF36]|jgi:hypothetical protein|uniref:hypothetical protein n=1 Tax=unclassified Bradyrhizobium TaxID=2631580 RepID=UPI001430E799|nr:hypothetical protein [Bradyrhizobium sp. MOS001]